MSIIVSLTSTSKRIHMCRATLISLATQQYTPDKIILNLSREPYLNDRGIYQDDILDYLTNSIPCHLKNILEIRWVENIGPYRKLIPTLQQASYDDIIITADDDIFYDSQWLKLLIYNFNPIHKKIHAGRVRKIYNSNFNRPTGYIYWPIVKEEEVLESNWIITYGGGAVLYRGWFSDELLNDTRFLDLAPTADDLWYSKICKLSNLQVKVIPKALDQLIFFTHNQGLANQNLPTVNKLVSKIKNRFIDTPLNYYNLKKFGNDIAYNSIESYFHEKHSK